MRKAILVIDMPTCCNECLLMFQDEYSYWCPVRCDENKTDLYDDYIMFHRKPDWCPLKELPKNKLNYATSNDNIDDFVIGYNVCINEILDKFMR